MNVFKRIKDYLKLKYITMDTAVSPIVQTPTEAIDEREMNAKKRARENFKKQEEQVMAQFSMPHDVSCGFPLTKCKQIPCFTHEPAKIVKSVKIKREKKSVPINKRFLE